MLVIAENVKVSAEAANKTIFGICNDTTLPERKGQE